MTGEETRVGSVVDEKYTIIDCLGRGGMANVWLARDDRLGKLWAIKEIKPNVIGSRGEVMRQALVAEADFMKRLDHPAIPRVVDIVDTGRTVFVVMDYVEGTSLAKLMRLRGGPFDQAQVIDWGIRTGKLEAPGYIEGDWRYRQAVLAVTWIGPSPINIDPKKEVEAHILAINAGLETKEQACRELYQTDYEETVERIQKEKAMDSAPATTDNITPSEKEEENANEEQ